MSRHIEKLKKRDGRLVDFDAEKIAVAINKAFAATYKPDHMDVARALAAEVVAALEVEGLEVPDVEHVQDMGKRVEVTSFDSSTSIGLKRACDLFRPLDGMPILMMKNPCQTEGC